MYVFRKQQPPLSATDHIALAVEHVMKLVPDTGQLPTRATIAQLDSICTALDYAISITTGLKREFEGQLETKRDTAMH